MYVSSCVRAYVHVFIHVYDLNQANKHDTHALDFISMCVCVLTKKKSSETYLKDT